MNRPTSVRRSVIALLTALAFGIVASVLKGNGGGVRDAVGNLSAPWLLVPMLCAAFVIRERRPAFTILSGAAVGLASTIAALGGFYLANALVLDLGHHSALHDVGLTLRGGRIWAQFGLLSGPSIGAVGALAAGRSRGLLAGITAALLIGEPLAILASHVVWPGRYGTFAGVSGATYLAEAVCGATIVAAWRRRTAAHTKPYNP